MLHSLWVHDVSNHNANLMLRTKKLLTVMTSTRFSMRLMASGTTSLRTSADSASNTRKTNDFLKMLIDGYIPATSISMEQRQH